MTILEFKRYFKNELSNRYSESESAFMYSLFIEKLVGFDRFQQRRFGSQELLTSDENDLKNILNELKTGKPYQQILGETEFYKMLFFLDENVLIPRPETEELLEIAIHEIENNKNLNSNPKILEVGTGSGIISIVLKNHFPNAEIQAVDISEKALEIAKKNAHFHKTQIQFLLQDYLTEELNSVYDIIISNPPYIGMNEKQEIASSVKEFEPKIALFSPTSDALLFYRKLAKDGLQYLSENGMIFLEINQKLGKETLALFENYKEAHLLKDLSENNRFIVARK